MIEAALYSPEARLLQRCGTLIEINGVFLISYQAQAGVPQVTPGTGSGSSSEEYGNSTGTSGSPDAQARINPITGERTANTGTDTSKIPYDDQHGVFGTGSSGSSANTYSNSYNGAQ